MSNFMLFLGIFILYLYICYASASSVSKILNQKPVLNGDTLSFLSWRHLIASASSPANNNANLRSIEDPPSRARQIEDLSTKNQKQPNGDTNKAENKIILANLSDNSIDTLDNISYSLNQDNLPLIVNNTNGLRKLEKELYTNNYQTLNKNPIGHNSRHYNTYHSLGSGNMLTATSSIVHHNKFTPPQSGTNAFSNNLNLNYIHSLLTKPTSSLSNLLNSNSNSLSSSYGLSLQNGYSSSYYSAPSPSSSINSIQQISLQQKPYQSSSPPPIQIVISDQQNLTINSLDFSGSTMCGKQQIGSREPRIVGGNNTYEGEFPWAVSIQRHGNHHCGGVIVGKRWILTAAHCVRSQLVGNLIVRTGGHTLTRSGNHITSHLERDYLVDQIVMHDDFSRYDNLTASQMKSSANTNNADIALLRLKHDIHWNELAWPVCFPNRLAGNFSGHDAIVIGWGKLNEKSEDFSNELQKVKLTIIDNKVCQNWFRQAGRDMPIDDRIICAGFKSGGKDACHGDSGGPLLSKINGHYVVVGVVSTGIGCARPLLPGLYSRVSSYIGWIERYVT